ncbi:MAG: ribonuclease H-like domain-containing protein [Bacteroidetes bacterium]|nr:ribonuclease H-like domain-containing protein [Bacteroidota bacterium]
MTNRYLGFDIETAKILPENFGDLHDHRPLGISCAAIWCADQEKAEVFYSKNSDGNPSEKMNVEDLSDFVDLLINKTQEGYTVVTHNGLGFDFDILAEESGRLEDCRNLALNHVDMMFHFFCGKGFAIGLNAAAKSIGISKPADVDGSVAPQLWKDGNHQQVLDYVAQDCRLTLDVALKSEKNKRITWVTRRGSVSSFDIPAGWLTVNDAMNLPLPDNSWMDDPWERSKFTGWLK